jgi:uncharacterized protein YbaR (Trm112 family)
MPAWFDTSRFVPIVAVWTDVKFWCRAEQTADEEGGEESDVDSQMREAASRMANALDARGFYDIDMEPRAKEEDEESVVEIPGVAPESLQVELLTLEKQAKRTTLNPEDLKRLLQTPRDISIVRCDVPERMQMDGIVGPVGYPAEFSLSAAERHPPGREPNSLEAEVIWMQRRVVEEMSARAEGLNAGRKSRRAARRGNDLYRRRLQLRQQMMRRILDPHETEVEPEEAEALLRKTEAELAAAFDDESSGEGEDSSEEEDDEATLEDDQKRGMASDPPDRWTQSGGEGRWRVCTQFPWLDLWEQSGEALPGGMVRCRLCNVRFDIKDALERLLSASSSVLQLRSPSERSRLESELLSGGRREWACALAMLGVPSEEDVSESTHPELWMAVVSVLRDHENSLEHRSGPWIATAMECRHCIEFPWLNLCDQHSHAMWSGFAFCKQCKLRIDLREGVGTHASGPDVAWSMDILTSLMDTAFRSHALGEAPSDESLRSSLRVVFGLEDASSGVEAPKLLVAALRSTCQHHAKSAHCHGEWIATALRMMFDEMVSHSHRDGAYPMSS